MFFASLAGNYLGRIDIETGTTTVLEPPVPRQGARRVWSDSRGGLWRANRPSRDGWLRWRPTSADSPCSTGCPTACGSTLPALGGTLRVATGECAGGFLARCLSGSTRTVLPPGITVELVDELRQRANLVRRQGDMALRHEPPESGDFYVAKLGTFGIAAYRCRGAEAAAWVSYTEEQAHWPTARWVERQVEETGMPVGCRASSMLMRIEAILGGTGRGELPCYVGDRHPLLERLTPPIPELAAEYWLIVHRDLRRTPCARAVIDWMKAVFAERRDVLAGVL